MTEPTPVRMMTSEEWKRTPECFKVRLQGERFIMTLDEKTGGTKLIPVQTARVRHA